MMNPLHQALHDRVEQPRSYAEDYILDHGGLVTDDLVEDTIHGHPVTTSAQLTGDERQSVADAIAAVEPQMKACFYNSLAIWKHNSDFDYVEGRAMADDVPELAFEHAWNSINGKLVDMTNETIDRYYGVTFTDEALLDKYYELGEERNVYGVMGNHADKFSFLREQGYISD